MKVPLNSQKIIIQGGNGFGKSAIIKSLYEALGTTPPKIDDRWRTANVSICLEIDYDGISYFAVKTLGVYSLFDKDRNLLFLGSRLVKDWGPRLAEFFKFKLEMTDREGDVIVPPPAYMFAPFYVDQDTSWNKEWRSFEDFYLPETQKTLADYHSGIRPDEYYSIKANLSKERLRLNGLEAVVRTLRETISQVQQIDDGLGPTYDLAEFKSDIAELIKESTHLFEQQTNYRVLLSNLHEEIHLVGAEKILLQETLKEIRGDFEFASSLPLEIDCPTCGQGYHNTLADRFALIADEGVLFDALGRANAKLGQKIEKEKRERTKLDAVENSLERIQSILDVRRASMSFSDIITAAGKTEAAKMLRDSLSKEIINADESRNQIENFKIDMDQYTDPVRTSNILKFFRFRLAAYSEALDVRLDNPNSQSIASIKVARGSEGPRALLAYYYAFLHTKIEFTSSITFPIVIDSPNQQGQDAIHLPQMLKFIFKYAPAGNQIIVATEDAGINKFPDVKVSTYGERKRQVLRDEEYEEVLRVFEPFTRAILSSTQL